MLVFAVRGKPEYPEKNLSEQRREPTTNSTHIWRRFRESNPGHIGGRRVLSPLRHPWDTDTYIFTWSIHEVKNNQMVKEYWERVLWNTCKTFSGNFLRAVYPHRLRINSKKTKTQCLSYFLVWKTMMVLKADDRCHATVHKGLQTLVWISCTWESMQKKLVCRRISCPWSKVRSWMMLIVLYLYTGGHTR